LYEGSSYHVSLLERCTASLATQPTQNQQAYCLGAGPPAVGLWRYTTAAVTARTLQMVPFESLGIVS